MRRSWVYILECSDGSYYTGCTTNIDRRISEHEQGVYPGYTSKRRPVRLLWSEEFSNIQDAIAVERMLKKWTRAKKEALMREDFATLKELAQSTKTKLKLKRSAHPSTLRLRRIAQDDGMGNANPERPAEDREAAGDGKKEASP